VVPTEWTDVCSEAEVAGDRGLLVHAEGVPILLVRSGGQITALADRCSHRGGPLHEGTVGNGCVTCPWHGSRFRLRDGAVDHGPATRPMSTFDVRVLDGRVQVRADDEDRSLRTNPVS
jgi:nitrite reductase/ring-hydroxylating ferredoxin subunit